MAKIKPKLLDFRLKTVISTRIAIFLEKKNITEIGSWDFSKVLKKAKSVVERFEVKVFATYFSDKQGDIEVDFLYYP